MSDRSLKASYHHSERGANEDIGCNCHSNRGSRAATCTRSTLPVAKALNSVRHLERRFPRDCTGTLGSRKQSDYVQRTCNGLMQQERRQEMMLEIRICMLSSLRPCTWESCRPSVQLGTDLPEMAHSVIHVTVQGTQIAKVYLFAAFMPSVGRLHSLPHVVKRHRQVQAEQHTCGGIMSITNLQMQLASSVAHSAKDPSSGG